MTDEKVAKAMQIWAECLSDHPVHQQVPLELGIALTKDRKHFNDIAIWFLSDHEQLFLEAIAVARQRGILKTWESIT